MTLKIDRNPGTAKRKFRDWQRFAQSAGSGGSFPSGGSGPATPSVGATSLSWSASEFVVGAVDGSNVSFSLAHTPEGLPDVYRDGILMKPGIDNDYTIFSSTVTFNIAPAAQSIILVDYQWLASSVNNSETLSGTVNGSNAIFTTSLTPAPNTQEVYRDGVRLKAGASFDYTISGNTITFNTAPAVGSLLLVTYFYVPVAAGHLVENETPTGTTNGLNTVFTLAHSPMSGQLAVYRDGVRLAPGSTFDYVLSGNTITFNTAPATGSLLLADYQYA